MDYTWIQGEVDTTLKEVGMKMTVQRLNGTAYMKVGSGFGVFVDDTQTNESQSRSSLLANTAVRTRKAILSPSFKDVQANDRLVADKVTYTIKSVTAYRPTTTTVAYEIEVT